MQNNDQRLEESGKDEKSNSESVMNNPAYSEKSNDHLMSNNEELSNTSDLEYCGRPPLPQSTPESFDKAYFDELFDWSLIEQRLRESSDFSGHQKQRKCEAPSSRDDNSNCSNEQPSVKLRDKQFSAPRSETERKRRSKDLLQNRRSTAFLSFDDVENSIKEIEEIGAKIQESFKSNNENLSDTETRSKKDISKSETALNHPDESDYGPVKLREKKSSSPFNSAASRKRRSRNLLLNRRSTGYVSVEDVEKAKSMDQQDVDDDDENPVLNN